MAETKPWERQRDSTGRLEPNRWFDRFTLFRLMGPNRSLTELCNRWRTEKGRKRRGYPLWNWRDKAKEWDWRGRAEAWDEHNRQEMEAEWVARRQETREQEWASSKQLLDRIEQMLVYPLSEATQSEDGMTTIIKPVRWSQHDVARFMEVASKLRRLATGMETERGSIEFPDGMPGVVIYIPDNKRGGGDTEDDETDSEGKKG